MSKPDTTAMPQNPGQTTVGEDFEHNPGKVLVALTSSLTCWFVVGFVGYITPSLPGKDDYTVALVIPLSLVQGIATFYLVFTAVTRGWSTPAATLSASIVGLCLVIAYAFWKKWNNIATHHFWMIAGVYFGLLFEAKFGLAEAMERRIATFLNM